MIARHERVIVHVHYKTGPHVSTSVLGWARSWGRHIAGRRGYVYDDNC